MITPGAFNVRYGSTSLSSVCNRLASPFEMTLLLRSAPSGSDRGRGLVPHRRGPGIRRSGRPEGQPGRRSTPGDYVSDRRPRPASALPCGSTSAGSGPVLSHLAAGDPSPRSAMRSASGLKPPRARTRGLAVPLQPRRFVSAGCTHPASTPPRGLASPPSGAAVRLRVSPSASGVRRFGEDESTDCQARHNPSSFAR